MCAVVQDVTSILCAQFIEAFSRNFVYERQSVPSSDGRYAVEDGDLSGGVGVFRLSFLYRLMCV